MAKAIIYSLKILMFRKNFKLTPKEEKSLRDLSIFIARIYCKAWITAHFTIQAPNQDLILLKIA